MMKNLLQIILMLFYISCSDSDKIHDSKSESQTDSVIYNYEDSKIIEDYINGKNDSLNYDTYIYYLDGTQELAAKTRNGKREGDWIYYYNNGNKKWVETYEAGIPIDTTYCYYNSGILKRKVVPSTSYHRLAFEYDSNSVLREVYYLYAPSEDEFYADSIYKSYYKNGQLKSVGALDCGYKNGNWRYFDDKGQLTIEKNESGTKEQFIVF